MLVKLFKKSLNTLRKEKFNTFIHILTILVFIFIVFSVYKISKYNLIKFDDYDIFYSNVSYSFIKRYFVHIYKAKIISNFLIIFSGYDLPRMLNYNLTAWIQSGGAIIKGIFWGILCFILSSTVFLFNKKNLFFPAIFIFTYVYLQFYYTLQSQNELYAAFYCFTFPFIFYILFWNTFIKIYMNNENSTKNYGKLFTFGVLTGLSAEITAISTFAGLIILFLFNKNKDNQLTKLFKYSFISTIIGNLIYFLNPNFINNAKGYGTFFSIKQTIENALYILPEYAKGYKETFFNYYFYYMIVIILLLILLIIFAEKAKRKNMLYMTLSLILGSYFFFTMLLFGGKPMNHTAVLHYDIIVQMIILFIYVIYFELSCISQNKKIFYPVILTILAFLIFQNFENIKLNLNNKMHIYDYLRNNNAEENKENYIYEFMLSYYAYTNKPVKIFYGPAGFETEDETYIYNYLLSLNKDYNLNNKITILDSVDDALKEYYNSGGRQITAQELDNPDIQKLTDKNFVLYGG